jgi:hypothetical protein
VPIVTDDSGLTPLFAPAADTLGLSRSEHVTLDADHPKTRLLRARHPGYWFDHGDLKKNLTRDVCDSRYARTFTRVWERMAEDGDEVKQLTIARNIKYLALAFAENSELLDRYNRTVAAGPFCSITPRRRWVDSCREVYGSVGR